MEILGRGRALCDIWGVGVPARALRCQNNSPTCALLLCPPVSRPEPEQAETPQERDSEEGKWRCALAASAWPPSAHAKGPGALTLSLPCALAFGRTNLSAPLPRAPNRVQPSQSRARVVGRALCKGEAPGHVAGGSWPRCHGAPEHSPRISLLPASSRWFLGGKVPGHVTHQVLLTVFALAPRPRLETGRAEPHRDTESGTKPNGNEGNVSFFFCLWRF